jgi:hypothetical protein
VTNEFWEATVDENTVTVDCRRCLLRDIACSGCVMSVLIGAPPTVEWDHTERRAIDLLADAGMVPRLRLVPAREGSRDKAA